MGEIYRISENVAKNIKYYSERIRVSQSELAERTGLTRQLIWRKLKNPSTFTMMELITISDALGVEIKDLFRKG